MIDFRYAPQRCWSCLGRPDDPYKTLVSEQGSLLYDFERAASRFGTFRFKRVIAFGLQSDRPPYQIEQQSETSQAPLVQTTLYYAKARLELITFGHQHDGDRRTDVVLWRIEAQAGHEFLTGLWLEAQELNRRFVPATIAPGRHIYAVEPAMVPPRQGLHELFYSQSEPEVVAPPGPLAFFSTEPLQVASAYDFGPASGLTGEPALVSPGQARQGALFFPLNHDRTEGFDLAWAHQARQTERAFWQGYELQPLAMALPDPAVQEMVTACARNLLQAREIKAGLPEFQVGPTVYRGLWVIDGYFLLEAAQYLGHAEAALAGLAALQRRVKPNGAIEERELDMKDTAIALATLVRQCELAGRMDRLAELWPVVSRAVTYLQNLRQESKRRGPAAPEYGLFPPAFANGGLGGIRPEYTTALWALAGLKAVSGAAQQLGYEVDAERTHAAFTDLLHAFRQHAERDMAALANGIPYLPMLKAGSGKHHWIHDYPGTPQPWHRVNPGTGTWALAQAIYPGQIFSPDDPLVQNFCRLLEQLDGEEGIPAGTGWLPYRAVWNYAASFYAHVWLYAGRPDKAIDYLYAFANHAGPTQVWREEQSLTGSQHGQMIGDMPHNWASAEFIRLVRHLLVFERGDILELLAGLPSEWLKPGQPLHLERTPTRFGPVTLTVTMTGQTSLEIEVGLDTGWSRPFARCLLHLPQGPDLTPHQVYVNQRAVSLGPTGVIELPRENYVRVTCGSTPSRQKGSQSLSSAGTNQPFD
jgi:hypothetical protein